MFDTKPMYLNMRGKNCMLWANTTSSGCTADTRLNTHNSTANKPICTAVCVGESDCARTCVCVCVCVCVCMRACVRVRCGAVRTCVCGVVWCGAVRCGAVRCACVCVCVCARALATRPLYSGAYVPERDYSSFALLFWSYPHAMPCPRQTPRRAWPLGPHGVASIVSPLNGLGVWGRAIGRLWSDEKQVFFLFLHTSPQTVVHVLGHHLMRSGDNFLCFCVQKLLRPIVPHIQVQWFGIKHRNAAANTCALFFEAENRISTAQRIPTPPTVPPGVPCLQHSGVLLGVHSSTPLYRKAP